MTRSAAPSPPPMAERLLRLLIAGADWQDAVIGDLREEFVTLAARRGRRPARVWYWRQALRLAGSFAVRRATRRPAAPRPWIVPADVDGAGRWRRGWLRDLRFAWRAALQRPTLTGVVVGTLALALAANTTIFSLMDAIVLRPYRFQGVERMVLIASDSPTAEILDRESVAPFDFREWSREVGTVRNLAAYDWWEANLSEVETPEVIPGFRVTPSFFGAMGMSPVLGRTFTDDEATPGRHRRAVISHALWARRFGSDPAIVGRSIRLDGEPHEVVGVAAPGFRIPFGADVWAPLAFDPAGWEERGRGYLGVIGRLADGASVNAARAELTALVARQRERHPDTHAKREVVVTSFTTGMADAGAGPFLALWQVAAALLLLIACANIANLLLARGTARGPEFSLRLALGASRGRLTSQLMLEGAVLALLAAAVSVPLTWAGLGLARGGIPPGVIRFVPGWDFIALDRRLLLLTAVLGAVATMLFSVLPALNAAGAGLDSTLRQAGRTATASARRQWVRGGLAAGQVALTLALLFGSGLMLSAADRAINGALGFDKRQVLTAQLTLPERPYQDPELRRQFIDRVLDRMRAFPAATTVAVTSSLPSSASSPARQIFPEGVSVDPQEALWADYRRVSPGLLSALRIPIEAGRNLTEADRADSVPVALVSRNFARRYWPDSDPVGRRFRTAPDGPWLTVVGVTGDVLHNWFLNERRPTVYRPVGQDPSMALAFVVRTAGDPMALAGDLRRAVAAVDPHQPIAQLSSMDAVVAERAGGLTFIASALGVVAAIAFVLAVAGVYSLMAYVASQRTKEIGVRLALGATPRQVMALTTGHALRITGVGLLIGAALAAAIGRSMEALLRGIVSNDLAALAVLSAVVALAAISASYLPARAATRVDPMSALRSE